MMTRSDAITAGLKFYSTGKECKNGHIARRYTRTGGCVMCQRDANKTASAAIRATRHGQPRPVTFLIDPADVQAVADLVEALALARSVQRLVDIEATRKSIHGIT